MTGDPTGRTGTSGVRAAGNVVDPRAEVMTAAGAGSAAASALNADLVDDDVRTAVRNLDHGFPPPTTSHGRPAGVLVSPERYEQLMRAWEDAEDVDAFDEAMAEEGPNIPWEQVQADLGWA